MSQPAPPTVTRTLPLLKSLKDLKEASQAAGHHFFDPDTMRGFGSRLSSVSPYQEVHTLAGGHAALFITSEQDRRGFMGRYAWDGARRYTVRLASFGSTSYGLSIDDAGPFEGFDDSGRPTGDHGGRHGAFSTLAAARRFAKACATPGTPERAAMAKASDYRRRVNGWPPLNLEA